VGESALEHIIDANPGNSALVQHRDLLQNARTRGIQAAYSSLLTSLHQQAMLELVDTWIGTPTWTQSRAFLAEHAADLLTDEAEHLLHALVDEYPEDPAYLTYFALISLSRREGADAAYALIDDAKLLRERAIGSIDEDDTDEADIALAVARLRAGLQPDDADAHFGHALGAVFGGGPQEAQRAILRCVETSASWERAGYAKRLTESTAGNAGLADQVALLRRLLLDSGSAQAD
jgi:hypothetical protein